MNLDGQTSRRPWLRQPTAIVVAHPDDETIGLGGHLSLFLRPPTIVHVTDGAPRDEKDAHRWGFQDWREYAQARRQELYAALSVAGLGPENCQAWGVPDQQASWQLESLTARAVEMLRQLRPAVVFTHPYEGGHPDHDAVAFAVWAAVRLLEVEGEPPINRWEFTSYHAGPEGMTVGEFLPDASCPVTSIDLDAGQRERKSAMLACFRSQRTMLQAFPIGQERVRPAPDYDFSAAPHPGRLFYENFGWGGIDGPRWRSLAQAALASLPLNALL
jgi:LmbE family N-acetylglucosaminyl deacetylase